MTCEYGNTCLGPIYFYKCSLMITESGLVGYSYGFKLQGLGSFTKVTTIANFFLRKFANEMKQFRLSIITRL